MERKVEAELLDRLPSADPLARGSRRDLERLNRWMGNARWMVRGLRTVLPNPDTERLADLGAGDGRLTLQVARGLGGAWERTTLMLVDREPVVSEDTKAGFQKLRWQVTALRTDALDWLAKPFDAEWTVITANLFLHHLSDNELKQLFCGVAARSQSFVAVEPRRSHWAHLCSRLVGCIGCNSVTRHDAPVSVRAGFSQCELSPLWPQGEGWILDERPAGLFGHLFMARRANGLPGRLNSLSYGTTRNERL